MTIGFEIYNDSGFQIAGSDFANLCFYGKGVISVPTTGAAIPMAPGGTFNFYRSSHPIVILAGRIYTVASGVYIGIETAGTVEYWSFGPVSPAAVNVGIEIYNAYGGLTFNTARSFLKVKGRVDVYTDSSQPQGRTVVYTPFNTDSGLRGDMAYTIGNARVYWTSTQLAQGSSFFTDTRRYLRAMRLRNDGICEFVSLQTGFRRFSGRTGNFNYSPNGAAPMTMMVADVSGL